MSYDFRHSLRAVQAPRRSPRTIATALGLLLAWSAWFVFGKVTVYVTTPSSRIEVEGASVPIESAVEGRVVTFDVHLGARVTKGEALVVLDAREDELKLVEVKAQQEAATARLAALRGQTAAEEAALAQFGRLATASRGEAYARSREAFAAAELAQDEARRGERLVASSSIAAVEYLRLKATATRQRATSQAMVYGTRRTMLESQVGESERVATLDALRAEEHRIEGEQAEREASIHLLELAREKRTLTAPCDGTVAGVSPAPVGARLRAGDVVATIVPARELQLVAELPAADAIGRVHAGQRARLRLDGFPWTQFGAVEATVVRVATEAEDGRIRAELTTARDSTSNISLQHGLSGSVEIEVDRLAPAALVLRRVAGTLRGGR